MQTGTWSEVARSISRCDELLDATIEGDTDKVADAAIQQIKDHRYQGELSGYGEDVLLVGISYNDKEEDKKKHTCVIEKINMHS